MLPDTALASAAGATTVYVAAFGDRGSAAGLSALEELRLAGIRAVSDFRSGTLKAHLRQADRLGCRFALIVGDDEVTKGLAVIRNMETKVQYDVSLSSLHLDISAILGGS